MKVVFMLRRLVVQNEFHWPKVRSQRDEVVFSLPVLSKYEHRNEQQKKRYLFHE